MRISNLTDRPDGTYYEPWQQRTIWIKNQNFHREEGPAVEYDDGLKEWFLHGKRHRDDGPAIEFKTMSIWYINGKHLLGISTWMIENDIPHHSKWNEYHKLLFKLRWS